MLILRGLGPGLAFLLGATRSQVTANRPHTAAIRG
jgi:hypothetical protein